MSEQPKRKPISIPKKTKDDIENQQQNPIEEQNELVSQEEQTNVQIPSNEAEHTLDKQNQLHEDEEWEKVINAKKEQLKEEEAKTADTSMEDEIERRVQERLKQLDSQQVNLPEIPVEGIIPKEQKSPVKSEEDIKKEQETIAVKNNAWHLIHTHLGTAEDFEAAITREFESDERPDSEKTSNPTIYAKGMAITRQLGQRQKSQKLLEEWIAEIQEKNTEALKAVAQELRLARITPKIGNGTGPKKLSGATAKAAVISRMKGMFRVQLYNSGFWLDLRPPTLIDIDGWMQEIDTDFKELGRTLGGHSHVVLDVLLKQKLCEIIPQLVQRSNFKDYEDAGKLLSNISFHDYDTILWALCCMMYREGVGIGIYCTNPDCRYVDDKQFVDLKNICYVNTEIFNSKALEWMTSHAHNVTALLTEEDLEEYRTKILGFTKVVSYNNNTTTYSLKVPSLREFISDGAALIGKITAITNGKKDIQSDIVSNQLTYHLYKMLTPWISSLSMNDDNGNLVYKIEDKEAIYESLDVTSFEDSTLYEDITNFIRDTKLSIYAAATLKCPKCGKTAEFNKDNLFPFDMQYLFFCLSCLQLEQTGASF